MRKSRLTPFVLRVVIVVFLLTAVFFAFPSPTVHAFGTVQKGAAVNSAGTLTATCCATAGSATGTGALGTLGAGDVLIVGVVGSWTSGPPTVSSITDTNGNVFTKQAGGTCTGGGGGTCGSTEWFDAEIWSAPVVNTAASDTITVTMTSISGSQGIGVNVLEAAGISQTATATSTGAGTTGTTTATVGSLVLPAGGLAFASEESGGSATLGTGYACLGERVNTIDCTANFSLFYQSEFGTIASGVVTPTNFPSTHSSAYFNVAGAIFPLGTTTVIATQTVGNCPSSPPGTFTPTNSTLYLYSGNALGFEVVNSVLFGLSSVTGSVGQSVQVVLLAAPSSGAVNANNPLTVLYAKVYSFSSGSGAQQITTQIGVSLNNALPIGSGNVWGVGVIGTSHTVLQTSGTSGVTTLASNAASVVEPLGTTFTTLGTTTAQTVCVQAVASYQIQLTTTSTTTATTTSTITGATSNTAISYDNLMLGVIVLLGPSLLIAGVTKSLWGGILGAVLGLAVGVFAGFLPLWTIAAVIIVSIAAIVMNRGSGGGGI